MDFSTDEMLCAQAAFGLAARLVQQEPDEAWVRLCIEEGLFDESPFGMDDPAVARGLSLLSLWCAQASGDVPEAVGQIRREWLRLFVGLGMPEAPIWETAYTEPNAVLYGRSTLSVRAAYREWGLEFERKGNEPDDALGIMLAFCSHLMGCELSSAESGDGVAAAKASSALEGFMVAHMLPWASAWRFLVGEHAKTDYYRGIGELVFGLQRAYASRFGIACNPDDGSFSYAARREA